MAVLRVALAGSRAFWRRGGERVGCGGLVGVAALLTADWACELLVAGKMREFACMILKESSTVCFRICRRW